MTRKSFIAKGFIDPPKRIPFVLRIGIWLTEKITGRQMLPARLLSWSVPTALGTGMLESLIEKGAHKLDKRLAKLVRIQTSFVISCPFCIDMNSFEYQQGGISADELTKLQQGVAPDDIPSLSVKERLVLEYVRQICQSPIAVDYGLVKRLKEVCREKELVIIASLAAKVNFWGRLIQALGIPPAGFTDACAWQPSLGDKEGSS